MVLRSLGVFPSESVTISTMLDCHGERSACHACHACHERSACPERSVGMVKRSACPERSVGVVEAIVNLRLGDGFVGGNRLLAMTVRSHCWRTCLNSYPKATAMLACRSGAGHGAPQTMPSATSVQ